MSLSFSSSSKAWNCQNYNCDEIEEGRMRTYVINIRCLCSFWLSHAFFCLNHNNNIDIDNTKSIAAELRCKTSSQKYWTLVSPTFLENSHNFYCGCEIQIYIFLWLQKFVTLSKENISLTLEMSKKVHQSCLLPFIDKAVKRYQ